MNVPANLSQYIAQTNRIVAANTPHIGGLEETRELTELARGSYILHAVVNPAPEEDGKHEWFMEAGVLHPKTGANLALPLVGGRAKSADAAQRSASAAFLAVDEARTSVFLVATADRDHKDAWGGVVAAVWGAVLGGFPGTPHSVQWFTVQYDSAGVPKVIGTWTEAADLPKALALAEETAKKFD